MDPNRSKVARLLALFALLALSAFLVACGGGSGSSSGSTTGGEATSADSGEPVKGGTLKFARTADADVGLNPIDAPSNGSIFTIQQVFDQLVEVGDGDEPVPGLAESWETSKDGLVWTFHLRDAQFSNGEPVTAEDVKFSVDRFSDPEININYATLGEAIGSTKVVDPKTVEIKLDHVDGAFLDALSMFAAAIVPKKVVEQVGDKAFAEQPVGSGPFEVTEYTRGQRTVLKKNPHYWRAGQPYLDEVVFEYTPDANTRVLKLRSGEVDVADGIPYNQVASLDGTEGITVQVSDSLKWDAVWLNNEEAPLDELEVRQALNYATPKEQILEAVLFGNATVANSVIPPVKYWDESVEPYPFDLAKAEQLMAKSSVPDGFDLDLTIPSGDPVEKQTAEIIKAEWAKIGVNVNIVQQEFGTMFANWLEGKGGMAATFPGDALSSDTLSDDEIAAIVFDPAAGLNSLGTGYENKKVIDLLGKAKGTLDEQVRADSFAEVQSIVLEDAPAVPLFFTKSVTGVQDSVKNFQTYPIGWWPLREVWVEE
jgi:peptide/nickel transport system substrate-binding protein